MRLRKIFVIGLALSLLGVGVPAWSEDDPRGCNDLMSGDTPAYVVCRWLATPDEAADIARFWLENDGKNMIDSGPMHEIVVDCTEAGNECATDSEGDGEMHDVGSPDVDGAEDGGTPDNCQDGQKCYIDPDEISAAAKTAAAESPAGQAVKSAVQAGLRTWIETELADDYKAGKLEEAAKKVAGLAAQPGVAGIRFTSQLGYNQTFATAEELDKFVAETTTALRKLVPGKKLAAHTVVPLFGCGANDACKAEMTKKYPLLDPARIGAWLSAGQIDQLTLDTAHLATEYATWKIDAKEAQRNQWIQVRARAWDAYAQIAAEDAGFTAAGSSALTAEHDAQAITDRVAAPLQADAAETVVLWSRWQDAQGQVNRVYGEKWAANATWDQLKKLGTVRPRLATVYDYSSPETDVATDIKNLSEVFGQVYLHTA
ncbi:hypothetical protein DMB42_48420 [Nonomuraea sp. WAC 01424]|uniref:hypothetical protein n=1 Tax=Nonomuraea sp. WAC 01424 TaxID=2203200 RepID=UPI000F7A9490|nr:hypothetical protein [Nonomuraea sp. WAC 01424]RSM96170.1 hypothetical protein DMB42_48420 [Nonomuraea sp. WAC 01424]